LALSRTKERRKRFSPIKVRLQLEKRGAPIPINEDRYRLQSHMSAHPSPDKKPQSMHNPAGQSFIGGCFQLPGALLILNELAFSLIPIGMFCGPWRSLGKRFAKG
jgi:hypothetical protein